MKRVVIAGMIGNALEWYGFALFVYYVPIISKLFFPAQDAYADLIKTYGIFAAGFIMRPLGGVFFGYFGDKFGRKFSLILSILMMAISTALIGLLPTYAQVGILAPILLTIVRLIQGLSLGGQFTGSIAFIVEHAPVGRRGLAGSTTALSLCAGLLMGSVVAMILAQILSAEALESWGWRVPFIAGLAMAFVGFYIQRHTEESPEYTKAKASGTLSQTPVKEAFSNHWLELLRGVGIYMSVTVPFYTVNAFLYTYLFKMLGHPAKDALLITTLSLVLLIIMTPVAGWCSDRIGHKRILMWTAAIYILSAYPIFILMMQPGFVAPLIAQLLLTLVLAFYIGPTPSVLVELFPTSIRYTGMAMSYNLSAAIFGGTTPMVATWLIKETNMNVVVAFYIMFAAVVSFISFIGYHDRYKEALH